MEDFKQLQALLKDRTLNSDQVIELLRVALQLRDLTDTRNNLIQFCGTRRREGDMNAWIQFNIIQENLVRGGMQVQAENKHWLMGVRKLRPLTSADRLLEANRVLTATIRDLVRAA